MSDSLWSSDMCLGVPSMDASHRTLLDKLGQLGTVPDVDFFFHYAAMVARLESDFLEEEALMEQIDFPGTVPHRAQHAKLLEELHRTAPAIMAGDVELGRHTVEFLLKRVAFHISSMDAALSFAVKFRQESVPSVPNGDEPK